MVFSVMIVFLLNVVSVECGFCYRKIVFKVVVIISCSVIMCVVRC